MNAWLDWQTGPVSDVALALLLIAAVIAWRHYGHARRTISKKRARLLLGVRLLTLTLLAATVLRPTLWSADPRPRPLHVVLDDSASMAVADEGRSLDDCRRVNAALHDTGVAPEAVRGLSRFDLALAAARSLAGSPAAAGGVDVTTLSGRPVDLTRPPAPTAVSTPLTEALHDATANAVAAGDDAVVLLSDGRSTEFRPRPPAAGAAVFAVAVAPEDQSPQVRVLRVETRPVVLAGQPVTVRVRLVERNAAELTARVELSDGQRVVSRDVGINPSETLVELTWPAATGPRLRLTARTFLVASGVATTRPAGAVLPGVTVDFVVLPLKERVLLLAGAGGRDVDGLAEVCGGAAWITLARPALTPKRPTTLPADAFAGSDLIVLSDLSPEALDDAAWAALTRAVREGGRSLLVLPGRGGWLGEPAVARHLSGLLPTGTGPRPRWVMPPADRGVWPVPSRAGADAAFLRLDDTPDASFRAWLARPRLSRLLDAGPPLAVARTLLVDRSTQAPVLLEAAAGRGRVAMVLVDEIWRWPIPADADPPQRRFWLNLARSLYEFPYDTVDQGLGVSLDRDEAVAGQPVTVRARADDPAAGPMVLSAVRGGVVVDTPPLREVLTGSGRATATVTLPPGDYDLVLRQAARTVHAALRVTGDARPEAGDLTGDPALLRGVAVASGGAVRPLERFDELVELIVAYRAERPRVRSLPLWATPWWFAAVVAALGLEWALRAESGLA